MKKPVREESCFQIKKTNKNFEDRWNRFCRKCKFIFCCECDLDNPDLPDYDAPEKIEINEN